MAHYINEVSRTFNEYWLIPRLTSKNCGPNQVNLKSPLVKFRKGNKPEIEINILFASAIMQSVILAPN